MSAHNKVKFDEEKSNVSLEPDWVQIEAIYTAATPKQTEVCSLVGRVVGAGEMAAGLAVGDTVIALAPLKSSITLTAASCQKVMNSSVITESMAFWAFTLALIPVIHLSELEIGEQVLVLSSDLVGQMLKDLAWLAGAESCVVVDPAYTASAKPGILSEPPHGPRYVDDLSALETILPDLSVDLLVDASSDSVRFQSNLMRVRNLGRVLTIGPYGAPRFDFNIYPDLHKRSLKLMNYRLPKSLTELDQDNARNFQQKSQTLDFVQYLFETGRLHPSNWPMLRIQVPERDMLMQALQATEPRTILVEW